MTATPGNSLGTLWELSGNSPYRVSVTPHPLPTPPHSDYEIRCRPAHGFHHVLSMTANMSDFTRVIKRQRISGNMDTPEGGLDAMLQAAVCQVGASGGSPLPFVPGIFCCCCYCCGFCFCVFFVRSVLEPGERGRLWGRGRG